MIIDAHTHIRLDPGVNGQEVKDLLANMDEAGIEKAAVFAASINDLSTEEVLVRTAKHQDRLFVVGSVSPVNLRFKPPPSTIEQWLADGSVRALKFYTGYEHFYPADSRLRDYLHLLQRYDRPAIFHCGDLYDKIPGAKLKYAHPLKIDDLASEMPDLKIVIAHLGSPWVTDAAEVCYKNRNVYADCSGFVYGGFGPEQRRRFASGWRTFDDITEGGAADKILFGSDWPISDMRSYIEVVRDCVGPSVFDAKADKVFRKNAEKIFGL